MSTKESMETNYKEYGIVYSEYANEWKVLTPKLREHITSKPSLAEAKKFIDRHNLQKFDRVKVFRLNGTGIDKYTVTSLNVDGQEFWATEENGDRGKHSTRWGAEWYLDNEKNSGVVEQYLELSKQIEVLQANQEKLSKKLQKYDPFAKKETADL